MLRAGANQATEWDSTDSYGHACKNGSQMLNGIDFSPQGILSRHITIQSPNKQPMVGGYQYIATNQ